MWRHLWNAAICRGYCLFMTSEQWTYLSFGKVYVTQAGMLLHNQTLRYLIMYSMTIISCLVKCNTFWIGIAAISYDIIITSVDPLHFHSLYMFSTYQWFPKFSLFILWLLHSWPLSLMIDHVYDWPRLLHSWPLSLMIDHVYDWPRLLHSWPQSNDWPRLCFPYFF